MALDHAEFDRLLTQAQSCAQRAADENDPLLYKDAFEFSLQAMRLLAEESGAWRRMVSRATEEFQGQEGI
ncbi:hypothetical protein [Stutzerimonas azotifigens]|uniref:hypothetical protein n=1 Tax=Stutzerimonas azotifigens TaxID=291995 RepID=UPI0003F96BA8|nr:hypothetical protein [Stutzerimonas azotifigens]